ncbi:EF-P beta-lysylation protein EpmB [Halomonas elongata]|uniref:L-lysine 2,3-aminomutase n=1 Tax=Halomonas elongata (strain ATCC 33173 / DSM 2581 / NBRC 15536 / NCIMB 2198 / 1H9) TaxID=768066 RepID=E1V848_HALED|nr:EF-P beta-lysylation protein EpmB [Halomonas elongata]WBF18849.1 EF-P beta-lysylation protein EpmB [Halomonas elongata]WPU47707.1 EF-P beta-lysylation protein EpmB [Halomonas elongata DSM 2581]CBV41611.2 lysine 2,3-aminomutase [Halomonas elongata DSM 2581]
MITRSPLSLQCSTTAGSWQTQLSGAIRDPRELCRRLGLEKRWWPGAETGHALFEVRVPEAYLARIRPGDPHDPLLRQVLPLDEESHSTPGFVTDPLEEREHTPRRGLIHKYAGRVLLIASPACAINCRYCFRRHFPYDENAPSRAQWADTLDYLRGDASIREAILSGGDPLAANDRQLGWLVEQLEAIPHLKRLRIHTRLPVVIPDRIDGALLDWLGRTRLQKVVVLHINHPNEIDEAVIDACRRLRDAGVTLLNQSVLLAGINDDVDTLTALSERLFEADVLPYYLHVLDPVDGAAHFEIDDDTARTLVDAMRRELPGFLMPTLVREIPGEASKTPI